MATRANGQPALAAYLPGAGGAGGSYPAYAVIVLVVAEGGIQAITGFQDALLSTGSACPSLRQALRTAACQQTDGTSGIAAR